MFPQLSKNRFTLYGSIALFVVLALGITILPVPEALVLPQLPEKLLAWIHLYGPIALFVLLALGIIILPVPDELMMVTAGFLIGKGDLKLIPTIFACVLGAWSGITVSYCIGAYLGPYIISTRFGQLLGLKGSRFIKTQAWFSRVGKWSLVIGYFIPGFRHFVGYIAGSLALPYRQFSLFAYSGGFVWANLFLTIGYSINQNEAAIMLFLKKLLLYKNSMLVFFSQLLHMVVNFFSKLWY